MGIQRAGYQTVQSAGKIQNVPLAHLELAVAAEDDGRWRAAALWDIHLQLTTSGYFNKLPSSIRMLKTVCAISGMISEPPVNVNDSDHSEPARLFVFAYCPGVTRRPSVDCFDQHSSLSKQHTPLNRFSKAKTLGYAPPVNNLLTPASESALAQRQDDTVNLKNNHSDAETDETISKPRPGQFFNTARILCLRAAFHNISSLNSPSPLLQCG
ncbi:hypothetical protein JOQ06_012115, partial [Pogonophryne albipinna]